MTKGSNTSKLKSKYTKIRNKISTLRVQNKSITPEKYKNSQILFSREAHILFIKGSIIIKATAIFIYSTTFKLYVPEACSKYPNVRPDINESPGTEETKLINCKGERAAVTAINRIKKAAQHFIPLVLFNTS